MADAGAASTAAEPAIGNQSDGAAQTGAHNIAGRTEHLLHTRTAFGAFAADNDDVTGFDFAGKNSFAGLFLALEDNRGAGMCEHFFCNACGFYYAALGSKITCQNRQAACL